VTTVSRRHKYGAKRETVDGIEFHSRLEARWYRTLRLLEHAGEISNLRLQVPFTLLDKAPGQRAATYLADFVFMENGKTVVVEAKGKWTQVARLKMKLFRARYPDVEVRIVQA
jgi:hypothetical protein